MKIKKQYVLKCVILVFWLGFIYFIYAFSLMETGFLLSIGIVEGLLILMTPSFKRRRLTSKEDLVVESLFMTSVFVVVCVALVHEAVSPSIMDTRLAIVHVLFFVIIYCFQFRAWIQQYKQKEWENDS